ncbi:protein of unknown function (plasmid) [Cupriavidus taiwanensis]|nr:protein of unknown function [Cupriavidus taiwanensis]
MKLKILAKQVLAWRRCALRIKGIPSFPYGAKLEAYFSTLKPTFKVGKR